MAAKQRKTGKTGKPAKTFCFSETVALPICVHVLPSRELEPVKVSPARSSLSQQKPVKRPYVTAGSERLSPVLRSVVSAPVESREIN